jgi:adenylosuccinate lyase
MSQHALQAISPIDGRYVHKTQALSNYFSEYALMKYRVQVEIEYFIELCILPLPQLKHFDTVLFQNLKNIYVNFSIEDAQQIKQIEKTTNHDVKAVEYFIKEKMQGLGLEKYKEFIHFGLTSQDVNNTAIPLSMMHATRQAYLPKLISLIEKLESLAQQWIAIPMLARTHGQAASPTSLGKELTVFVERLQKQKQMLENIYYASKFGGATGNFNAHYVAYPNIDWVQFAKHFVENNLQLKRSTYTTQIEHYDMIAAWCHNLVRINTILIDLNRDMWQYISMDYFKQQLKKGEIGSSAMPHKVNPIDFENSEGNLGIANALFEHFAAKLPISRLQRDLTDSTVLRNIGVPLAHTFISLDSCLVGLNKLLLNKEKIEHDLEQNWAVVAEAIQTILRRENYPNPYEALKNATRGQEINKKIIKDFIESLEISDSVKEELNKITPQNYIGKF